ncbi:MAG TPA: alpha/beta fold hydrolase [Burkholderiales bacterium]|nr:alpha/beta fold hydrolase [Burkholderiales bacterium]
MRPTALRIAAADGYSLGATLFAPDAPNDRVVVLNAAMGVKCRFYAPFALHLAARGFTAVTYDYRGIGDSRPPRLRSFPARLADWGERDFAGVLDWVAAQFPAARMLAIGHSVGGQIVGLAPNADRVAALLCVAAQSGYWGHWSMARKLGMWALWHAAMPIGVHAVGYFPSRRLGLGEDLPPGVARQWAEWGRSAHYIAGPPGGAMPDRFVRLRLAIRAYSFGDDHFAPRPAVDALLGFYRGATAVEHRHVAPAELGLRRIGHFGFFREGNAPALWADAAAWLTKA